MRRFFALALAVCLLLPSAIRADEPGDYLEQIPSCGQVLINTELWQYDYELFVKGFSQTRRQIDGCLSKLRVEAWVEETTGAVATNESYGAAASVWFGRPVNSYKTWTAVGKHWVINFGAWIFGGFSRGSTAVVPKPPDDEPPPSEDPLPMYGSP